MIEFINLAFIALGAFAFVTTGVALFISIPQGKLNMPQARIARSFTAGYRQGGLKKFLLFMLGATFMGMRFSKLDSAMRSN